MIPFYHKATVSFLERSVRLMSQPLDDKIVLVGVSGTVVSVPNNSLKVVGCRWNRLNIFFCKTKVGLTSYGRE